MTDPEKDPEKDFEKKLADLLDRLSTAKSFESVELSRDVAELMKKIREEKLKQSSIVSGRIS
ncbi:hypothetical protein [Azotobacter chroococcum]|uniref:hypothetical protein n=1 Tax=Azotobacter chroococcum TaxID=353 RepID=UPI0011864C6F|nr:hypothetical protein [Azotobacter chroococcum]